MLFRLLGPLEVDGPRGTVALKARRQQVVLTVLLLGANQLVPADRLIDAVWSHRPPPTARGQIHTCVSALRRAFAKVGLGERIGTRQPGYVLRVADVETDLHHFDRLVAQGRAAAATDRHAEAAHLLRSALGLWRGEQPLSNIDSEWLGAVVAGLTERRLTVVEQCHAAELSLGRHRELIEPLVDLVGRYPLRERLCQQLMLALYRSGRVGEALAVYRAARETCVAELGIEPSESLRDLHRRILDHDAALNLSPVSEAAGDPPVDLPARPIARTLPADNPLLVGREELADAAVRELAAETAAVRAVVLTGRAGMGKTALAVHIGHRLADRFPDGQLYVRLSDDTGEPIAPVDLLASQLTALGVTGSALPAGLAERAAAYRSALADRRAVIVLDGAVDDAQILALLPGSPTCGVLVTSRHRLVGLPGARVAELAPLDVHRATDLLVALVGADRVSAEPAAAFELVELCGGVPMVLVLAGRRLGEYPHWTIAELTERLRDEGRRLDELSRGDLDVRAGMAHAYHRLPTAARTLFRLLGTLESDFAAWVTGPLLADQTGIAGAELDCLVAAHLIEVRQVDGERRYRMPSLLRLYARERLAAEESTAGQVAAQRRLLGAWLYLVEQARQRRPGDGVAAVPGVADRWPVPTRLAHRLLHQPLRWLTQERENLVDAVGLAAALGCTELCRELAVALAGLFQSSGHLADWRTTHAVALAACQRGGDRRGEAAVLHSLATLDLAEQRFDVAAGRLLLARRTFEEVGDDHGRALCLRSGAFLTAVATGWDSAAPTTPAPARPRTPVAPR